MRRFNSYVIWLAVVVMLATIIAPASPAYALSINDLVGQSALSGSGTGFFSVFLGLLFGNLLNKIFHVSPETGDSPISAGSGLSAATLGRTAGHKELMGFYAEWWADDTDSYTSFANNASLVKTIIPFWASLQADGTLTDRGGRDHAAVIRFAKQNNSTVLLMVNNAKQGASDPPIHQVLSDPELRTAAIDNLEAYIKQYGLGGVNIDFELVPAADRDNLSAFMRELYQRLKPQGLSVSIDVFPKTDETNDVAIAYDYERLAQFADRIVIMTYDNHGTWSGPGPIAAVNWVEDNLKYARQFIPQDKLYLGVAGYGYDWSAQGVESLEYQAVQNLISRFGAVPEWDKLSEAPHFTYTAADGTNHTVWYENSESLKYKLDLINKYNIAGAALWKLGDEDPACWPVFQDRLLKS